MTKQTHFYVKVIKQGAELFSGYGVTDNIEARDATHLENLTKAGYTVVSTEIFPFPTRAEADALEKTVIRNTRSIDLKVDGFRTEAAPFEQYAYIISMVYDALHKKSGSPNKAEGKQEPHYKDALNNDQQAMLKELVSYWQRKLEIAWGGRISGQDYRDEAKSRLQASLESLVANTQEADIYLPTDWNYKLSDKPANYSGEGFDTVSLDFLRRDKAALSEKRDRLLVLVQNAAKLAKKNAWYLALSEEDQTLLQRGTLSFYDYYLKDFNDGWQEHYHTRILKETMDLSWFEDRLEFLKESNAILKTLDLRIVQIACAMRSNGLTDSSTMTAFKAKLAAAKKDYEAKCAKEAERLEEEKGKKRALEQAIKAEALSHWYQYSLDDDQKKFFNTHIKYRKDYPELSVEERKAVFEETYGALKPKPTPATSLIGKLFGASK